MKKELLILLFIPFITFAQVVKDYDPSIQRTTHLQYFKPLEKHLFSGDCMPYYHNGVFYLYWLLDEGHHAGLDGLGGHQWALSTTTDLINWKHYPVALGIENEEWEKSICTGSVIAEGDKFYAFYATRVKENEKVHEQLSYAISTDGGLQYKKQEPNPFYYAPEECISRDFRDPKVFKDPNGIFHLFVSGNLKEPHLDGFGGYLVHLVSPDLISWKETDSPIMGQRGTPECADYFKWNKWYYLFYSIGGHTYYLKSEQPYGPWEYPCNQPFIEHFGSVYKTAEFRNGRRIAVAYSPCRRNDKDNGDRIWGGNILFREIQQQTNGDLSTMFLKEVLPEMNPKPIPPIHVSSPANVVSVTKNAIHMSASGNIGIASLSDLPENYRISMKIEPEGNYEGLGLFLRATDKWENGYRLEMNADNQTVIMQNTTLFAVKDLDKPILLDVIVLGEFFDVSVNNSRCMLNRLPEKKGRNLFFYVKNGNAVIRDINIQEITQ